jgi:hypothetical protein
VVLRGSAELAAAKLAFDLDQYDRASEAIDRTLESAKRILVAMREDAKLSGGRAEQRGR